MEEAPAVVFVEMRDAKGGGAHRGKAIKRLASRWRCFKRKYVFFSGEGLKGSEVSKCVYSGRLLGS